MKDIHCFITFVKAIFMTTDNGSLVTTNVFNANILFDDVDLPQVLTVNRWKKRTPLRPESGRSLRFKLGSAAATDFSFPRQWLFGRVLTRSC